MADLDLEAIKARIDAAHDHVCAIAEGKARWTMSIPAKPDTDSDLLLGGALFDAAALVNEVERLRAWVGLNDRVGEREAFQVDEIARLNAEVDERRADVNRLAVDAANLQIERDAALAEAGRLRAEMEAIECNRLVSAIFSSGSGAPRPLALYTGGKKPDYLGAQWPDGFIVLQGPEGGAMPFRDIDAMQRCVTDDTGLQPIVVWLSDELEPLAEMEIERDRLTATIQRVRKLAVQWSTWEFGEAAGVARMFGSHLLEVLEGDSGG